MVYSDSIMSRYRAIEYHRDHRLAKTIVCFLVVLFLVLGKITGWIIMDIIAVPIWFFGVNPIQYVIETLRHHKHKVRKL